MELRDVLLLHALSATFSGFLALAYPPMFGVVFPSLTSAETLAFTARMYNVLVATQSWLLVGVRRIDDLAVLRHIAMIYTLVFAGTGMVAFWSEQVVNITSKEVLFPMFPVWTVLASVYGVLALVGSLDVIRTWTYVHGAVAFSVGMCGILVPDTINQLMFKPMVADQATYQTISQYYGILILGMSLLTQTFRSEGAAPARPTVRLALASMFAASGMCFSLAIYQGVVKRLTYNEESLADGMSIFSLVLFVGLSFLYTHSTDECQAKKRAKGQ